MLMRQGDALLKLLFILVIEAVQRNVDTQGNIISYKTRQIAIMVIGRSDRAMGEKFLSVQQETEKMGLVVYEEKTNYLKVAKDAISDYYLKVEI